MRLSVVACLAAVLIGLAPWISLAQTRLAPEDGDQRGDVLRLA